MAAKFDVYDHVTNSIITQIKEGTPPWRQPWTGGRGGASMPTRFNGESYRGINVLLLWLASMQNGFNSSRWMTFKQARDLGGCVTKGQKSSTVVKYGTFERPDQNGEEQTIPYAKAYRVFNADQIEGLPEEFYIRPEPMRDVGTVTTPEIEAFINQTGAVVKTHEQPEAFYNIKDDEIYLPPVGTFHTLEGYFSTLAHETVHWTGANKRLDRFEKFTTRSARATEELIAEIGSCMIAVHLGIEPEIDQAAAYVEGWLEALKNDKRMIFKAASEAQKAVDYILNLTMEQQTAA